MSRRIVNILIGLDQFMQVIIYFGNYTPDETISGIIGRKVLNNEANFIEKSICFCLRKLQSKHCVKNIDWEENIKEDA